MMSSTDIAIIGLGSTLPGALDPDAFWADQVAGRHRIGKLPAEIWDVDRLVDPTRRAPDRPYSGIGAVVRGMSFDPRDFGMPPRVGRDLDPCQQAALLTARQALADAGIEGPTDGVRAAVLIGNVQGGSQMRGEGWFRVAQPLLEDTLADLPTFRALSETQQSRLVEELRAQWLEQYPPVSGDSLPGLLGNLIAARIAHYYNFRGPAVAIDAACASSLVAIEQAVHGLRGGRFDLAVAGGVDFQMDVPTYVGFCAMGALSAEGSYPFDRRASGFVMGEGAVTFVLKRLVDAERDGDHVYAVVHGVGSSSDGRGRALVAPSVEGQVRAIREAWRDAKRSPETLGYLEAHGTATMIGDPTEAAAVREAFGQLPRGSVPMGSVKANLGHLKAAAGAVGMLRAVLALHEGVVPPQAGFETPNPRCKLDASPVRLPRAPEPFGGDRSTAAVSAFGFGGINTHVVLGRAPGRSAARSAPRSLRHTEPPLGLGIVAFGASSRDELTTIAKRLRARVADPLALARELAGGPAVRHERVRVAFHALDTGAAQKALDALIAALEGRGSERRLEALGVTLASGAPLGPDAVAFMFPGQGSQYVGMLDELRARFPVVQATLDEADAITASLLPRPLSSHLAPGPERDPAEAFLALCRTEILQPAMLACDEALRRLIAPILSPGFVLGHSLGEYGACVAAGVLGFEDALRIVTVRGDATSRVSIEDPGLMLGVSTDEASVRAHLGGVEGYVEVVNKNCPTQTILGGSSEAVRAADARLRAAGLETLFLPVSHAFHSRIVAPVSPLLREALGPLEVRAPRVRILSNVTAGYYPTGDGAPDAIRDLLAEQMAAPVEFIGMVERAHADGARVFVEVGPKRAQAGFVSSILAGKPHRALHLCHPKPGELETLGRAVAALVADGVVGYGDPRKRAARSEGALTWRPPYVPRREGTPVVRTDAPPPPPLEDESASVILPPPAPVPALAPAPESASSSAVAAAASSTIGAASPSAVAGASSSSVATAASSSVATAASSFATAASSAIGTASPSGVATAGGPARSLGALDDVAGDPRFWQFLAAQGPSLASFVMASFRAATSLGAAPAVAAHVEAREAPAPVLRAPAPRPAPARAREERVSPPSTPVATALPREERMDERGSPVATALSRGERADQPATPVATGPAPASGPTVDARALRTEAELTDWVLRRVAEVTGYTTEELGLDADLESELGIDSIRQIEVVIDIRDALGLAVDDAFKMSDYPTLRSLVAYLARRAGLGEPTEGPAAPPLVAPSPAPITPPSAPPAAAPLVAPSPAPITPPSAPPVARTPPPSAPPAASPTVALGAARTPAPLGAPAAPPAAPPEVPVAGASSTDVSEWVLARVVERTGYTRDELALDADLEAELGIDSIRQVEIVLDVRDSLGLPVDDAFKMSDYPTLRALIGYVEGRLGEHTRPFDHARPADAAPGDPEEPTLPYFVRDVTLEPAPPRNPGAAPTPILVLHRGADATAPAPVGGATRALADDADAQSLATVHAPFGGTPCALADDADEPSLTALLRTHAPRTLVDLRALGGALGEPAAAASVALTRVFRLGRALLEASLPLERVLVVTRLDGALGFEEATGTPSARAAAGAAIGAWKSVAREWQELGRPPFELTVVDVDHAVRWTDVAAELGPRGPLELALGGGRRRVPVLRPRVTQHAPLAEDAVVVVLGGGRGITARIAASLATRTRRRLVLVGRTAVREDLPPLTREEARRRARASLGADAPRAEVNALVGELERAAELTGTLAQLRAEGVDVSYLQADATDPASVAATLRAVRESHGRIDLVLHGAGVDRSRALQAKSEAELAAVLAPKLGPLPSLLAEAPEARWVALSSVSARFGNAGQIDYAAANEALAKVCLGRGGLVLDFSAWAEVGMAAPLARALAERGVDLLEPASTARFAAAVIASGHRGESVIAGRVAAPTEPVLGAEVASLVPGAMVEHRARLALESAAYLRDHRVRTAGLLPGVVALAALEQAALALEPSLRVAGLRAVEFAAPLKVFTGRPVEVRVRAERGRPREDALPVDASTWTGSTMHHRAEVCLAPARTAASAAPDEPPPEDGPDASALYRAFFHGPSFQVVASTRLGDGVASARSAALAAPLGEDLPEPARWVALARELALQVCGVLMQVRRRELALPVGVGTIDVHDAPRAGEVVDAYARLRRADAEHRWFDVITRGADGRTIETLREVRFRVLASLERA